MSHPVAPFAFGDTVEIERGPEDEHGDRQYAVVGTLEGVWWAPRYSNENNDDRSTTIVGLTLYGAYGADVRADDRVVLPNRTELPDAREERTYRVVGDRGDWRNPMTGWAAGSEIALERVE